MYTMKTITKKILRRLGFEVQKFTPLTSEVAQMQCLFAHHSVDLVLDVGANIGQYTQFLREFGYSGRIVSFEPLSSAYSQLKLLSEKDPLWEVAPRTAIGNIDGKIEINISANSQSSSVLDLLDSHLNISPNSAYIGSEIVDMKRLDTVADNYIKNNDDSIFLKMDVQGFEMQVLEGATKTLPKIQGVQMELSLVPLYDKQILFRDILEKMNELNYCLYGFMPAFTDLKTGRMLQIDGIFFKA
jgi:FkbM family methyltransferase